MKLIYCNNCKDIIRLHKTTTDCLCGESGGHYKEDGSLHAIIYGNCKPLGFDSNEFKNAIASQPEYGEGRKYTAYVIPRNSPTVEHVDSEDYESTEDRDWLAIFDDDLMDELDEDIIKDRKELNKKNKIKNVFKDEN